MAFSRPGRSRLRIAIQQLRRRVQPISILRGKSRPALAGGIDRDYYRDPEEFFRSGRAVVNCEGEEDFRYLIEHLGDNALMCSSDYPHADSSAEEDYVEHWQKRTDVPPESKEKILGGNAARFFKL